jgi:3-(3-hydroxy-phenyl)propionate hydroxylase
VLTGHATPDLLSIYQSERRPHARALIRKAKLVGWAMTGGQDAAAAVRRLLLSAAVRSSRIRDRVASTATPPLHAGALDHDPRLSHRPRNLRVGALIPNPVLCLADGKQVPLDDILDGVPAMLTAHRRTGIRRRLQALTGDPSLTVLVRPDRVIAAVSTRSQLPPVPWTLP